MAASLAARQAAPSGTAPTRAPSAALPRVDALPDIERPADAVDCSGWPADPAVAVQVEEALSTLTLKRRRFLLNYLESGNARRSVLTAGYACKNPRTADDIAREILSTPAVAHAYQALLEAQGLGLGKLHQIHALHLSS